MAKRLAWLLIAACLILTACSTATPQKKESVPEAVPEAKEQPKEQAPAKEAGQPEEQPNRSSIGLVEIFHQFLLLLSRQSCPTPQVGSCENISLSPSCSMIYL